MKYEQWVSSATQSEVFFGDLVDDCYMCPVLPGNTLFIPTGMYVYVHACLLVCVCVLLGVTTSPALGGFVRTRFKCLSGAQAFSVLVCWAAIAVFCMDAVCSVCVCVCVRAWVGVCVRACVSAFATCMHNMYTFKHVQSMIIRFVVLISMEALY